MLVDCPERVTEARDNVERDRCEDRWFRWTVGGARIDEAGSAVRAMPVLRTGSEHRFRRRVGWMRRCDGDSRFRYAVERGQLLAGYWLRRASRSSSSIRVL